MPGKPRSSCVPYPLLRRSWTLRPERGFYCADEGPIDFLEARQTRGEQFTMKIRRFSMQEYGAVSRLWRRAGLETSLGDAKQELKRKVERDPDLFLVAEQDSEIIGAVMGAWDGRRGWIYHLAVDPGARRKSVATKMLRELEGRMREKGVLKVNAMVYLWNDPSLKFFDGMGYRRQSEMVVVGKPLGEDKRAALTRGARPRRRSSKSQGRRRPATLVRPQRKRDL